VTATTTDTSTGHGVPALELRGITKRYGSVLACDRVDLTVLEGEIHGLLGENGAGKSTLMNVVIGLVAPDAGSMLVDGRPAQVTTPQQAAELGIAMVHQHLSLVPPLTVWENVALGGAGRIDKAALCEEVAQVSDRYGLPVDPLARVADLTPAQRQRVELVKCLRREPRVLVLDEPTSVLTAAESEELFSVLRRVVAARRCAVILISHKLAEIMAATDRVTVLRRGGVTARLRTAETSARELARQVVGRDLSSGADAAALGMSSVPTAYDDRRLGIPADAPETAALSLHDLTVAVGSRRVLDAVSLTVAPGELVGLYGVEGSGQTALGDILSGLGAPTAGRIEIGGVPIDSARPGALTRAGLGIVPEDRQRSGVVLDMSVAENLAMKSLPAISGRLFVSRRRMTERARALVHEFDIVTPSVDAPLRTLSGGNQQRVVLARELSAGPRALVAAQPTQGLDVGATEDMYARLRAAARSGVGVLLISTELEEILALATRIFVLARGRIVAELRAGEATAERLGTLAAAPAA
jgi:simple sugar transport system ATP-binding protein